jgi:hypothetical protein
VKRIGGGAAALVLLLGAACTSSSGAQVPTRPSPAVHSLAGGCAGTVLGDAAPPKWAQGGWSTTTPERWPVPWAIDTTGDAIAFVFATRLVAGASPRVDGTSNKVLWEVRNAPSFVVEGRPAGKSQPVVTFEGGPSIVDVPTAGCWTFRLIQRDTSGHVSTISLDALPQGSTPG